MVKDRQSPFCSLCGASTDYFASADLLDKFRVSYFRCPVCGTVRTEDPFWHDDAYSKAITGSDVGLVARNIVLANVTNLILSLFFNKYGKFVDYGGGYGLFVRLMRDRGFDFYRYDTHCENLFAADFEADTGGNDEFELVTAFELFEHLSNPLEEISELLELSTNILFSTELLPDHAPAPGDWWYYGLEHGQHVTFYTPRSLAIIAKKFSLNLYSNGINIHLLTDRKLSPLVFRAATSYKLASLFSLLPAFRTLTKSDYFFVVDRLKNTSNQG